MPSPAAWQAGAISHSTARASRLYCGCIGTAGLADREGEFLRMVADTGIAVSRRRSSWRDRPVALISVSAAAGF
jgi:hypothetical protein